MPAFKDIKFDDAIVKMHHMSITDFIMEFTLSFSLCHLSKLDKEKEDLNGKPIIYY